MKREEELIQQGWEKQSTYDEPRLAEMVELYEEIGYEVTLIPFFPEEADHCTECMKVNPEQYKTIFTRKKSSNKGKGESHQHSP